MLSIIKNRAEYVASNARHVSIAEDKIDKYIQEIDFTLVKERSYDIQNHYKDSPDDTAAYIIVLDTINFGSGYFHALKRDPNLSSGYFHISRSLKEYFEKNGILNADRLQTIEPIECAQLFNQDISNPAIAELMELFALSWNELGTYVCENFSGSFIRTIASADQSADRFVEMLSQLNSFRDESNYKGVTVPFYKRAQIAVSDLALSLEGKGLGFFKDIDRLTVFADNRIPQVLNLDGILHYSDRLKSKINNGEEIPKGSEEEVEIRACCIHACELILRKLNVLGMNVNAAMLDNYLWNKGQNHFYKSFPTHQTRQTTYY
ncbi:MAG: queuosine salvage family protein [Prochloraceae cyanobacterium]|nr:queuosine salvage family protein [Prochloraceae cyanobacterium]